MASGALTNVLVIAVAAAVVPLVADLLRRWLVVPTAVLEISLGIALGPAALGVVHVDDIVAALASFGLALLFFLAGYEVDVLRLLGPPLNGALLSWVASLLLGLAVGAGIAALLGGGPATAVALALALATTALGTILPAVRDAGLLPTPLGARILAVGAVGEFGPILAVTLLFSGGRPTHATLLLVLFAVVAIGTVALATRQPPARMTRLMSTTLGTSAQFAVRLSLMLMVALVWLAVELHLDLVLGAFAAGMVMRQVLRGISRGETQVAESKLEAIGYGVLIPFFFVTAGVRLNLAALLGSPVSLVLLLGGLLAFALVRGAPVGSVFRAQLPRRHLVGLAMYASTTLPLVVVIGDRAVSQGWLDPGSGAALVGAAMLSVLVYPLTAQRVGGQPDGSGP